MTLRKFFSSKVSWMSAGAVVVVAGVLTATTLANAAAPPLPKRTPAQLLVAMRDAKFPAGFSGVITESANLGFPAIPNIAGLSSPALNAASLLTGTHTVDVWYAGPARVRIALPVSFGETDLRVNGNQVWLWESHSQTATHYVLPALPTPAQIRSAKSARLRMLHVPALRPKKAEAPIARWNNMPLTPQQAVSKLLKAIGPTTKVTVNGSADVAGRAAYQLQIAPRSTQSLIDRIVVAVDAKTSVPLRLQVFARGTASPALQIGFTSLSLATPAMSNFTFTPPAGAHVKTEHVPGLGGLAGLGGLHGFPGVGGPGWHPTPGIRPIPQPVSPGQHPAGQQPASHNAGGYPQPPGLRSPRLFPPTFPGGVLPGGFLPGMPSLGGFPFGLGAQGGQMLGSGWLSVAVFQAGPMLPVLGGTSGWSTHAQVKMRVVKVSAHHPGVIMVRPATGSVVIMRAYNGPGPQANEFVALIRVLLNAATPVHGSWGSGKLLRTSLFSALMTSNGKVLIGAVTPAVLYADAAKVK